jgi:hypothetical protein
VIATGQQELTDALYTLDPSCDRQTWVRALTGFKAGSGDIDSAHTWSEGGDSFRSQDFHSTWRSINADGEITEKTLFGMARDVGWRPDRQSGYIHRPKPKEPKPEPVSRTQPYAFDLWKASNNDDAHVASHSYCLAKGVKHAAGAARGRASGRLVGMDADCVLVPQRTLEGVLVGVECINREGIKQSFGKKGVLVLGNDLDPGLPQIVVEGWATAAAILAIYHWNACVYACFGKGMMEKLAVGVGSKYPKRQIIIGGEKDD